MVKVYLNLIKKGLKTIDDIKNSNIKNAVQATLDSEKGR